MVKIPEGWIETTLGELITDIASGPFGSNLKIECFVDDGFPIIDGANLKNIKLTDNITKFVTEEKARSLQRSIAKRNDLVVTISGTLGQVSYIPENSKYDEYLCSQRQFRVTFNQEKLLTSYIANYLHTNKGQQQILMFANYVGVPALSQPIPNFKKIKVTIPQIKEQMAIMNVLSSFDDKIELLRAENQTLEEMGQTLFKERFGKYKVGDELPDGWKVGKLGEVVDNFDSKRIPIASDKREVGEYPYYGATGINGYIKDYIFDGIYTLLGEDGSVMKENGKPFTQYVRGKIRVNNHAHVLQGKNGFSTEMIKIILDSVDITPYVTGAVQLKISQQNMNSIPVTIPTDDVLVKFNSLINPIFSKIRANSEGIESLSKTRDQLLPKLMSGEVRVEF